MKLQAILVLVLPLASAFTTQIGIQPIHPSNPPPAVLAEIAYTLDVTTSPTDPTAVITAFELPGTLPDGFDADAGLVRIGVLDPLGRGAFAGATTVARAANLFAKGYAPTLQVLADPGSGAVASVGVKGVRIDAGYTRDFGPRVEVRVPERGRQPELNRPVVLNAEGKRVEEQAEKTMLQKYWWLIGVVVLVTMLGGNDSK